MSTYTTHRRGDFVRLGTDSKQTRARLMEDFVQDQREQSQRSDVGFPSAPAPSGQLVFSVSDDMSLYGAGALEEEFRTRKAQA